MSILTIRGTSSSSPSSWFSSEAMVTVLTAPSLDSTVSHAHAAFSRVFLRST